MTYPVTPEALARKRKLFPMFLQACRDAQPGGKSYQYTAQMKDRATADANAQAARERLVKQAADAQVDLEGNPLP